MMICSTIKDWNDVIQFKIFCNAAKSTNRRCPFFSLPGSELFAMSSKFGRFMKDMIFSSWENFKHFVSIQPPQFTRGIGNSFSCFFSMVITKGIFVSNSLSFSAFRNFPFRFIGMNFAPKRIVPSNVGIANTGIGTIFRLSFSYSPCLTVKLFATRNAIKILTGFMFIHRMPPSDNGVNSRNNSILCYLINIVKYKMESILSQAQKEIFGKVQRLWDKAKAFAMPVISRTSAPPERDEIV